MYNSERSLSYLIEGPAWPRYKFKLLLNMCNGGGSSDIRLKADGLCLAIEEVDTEDQWLEGLQSLGE